VRSIKVNGYQDGFSLSIGPIQALIIHFIARSIYVQKKITLYGLTALDGN
jgi:hypothetical protein